MVESETSVQVINPLSRLPPLQECEIALEVRNTFYYYLQFEVRFGDYYSLKRCRATVSEA